ncbi:MAG: orotate phosphoribosyltransferase-like protein [Thermoplasmatota archaeon]
MNGIDALVEKAKKYKERGLKEKEIAVELNISPDTVTWLLTRDIKEKKPPVDVQIDWESIGVYGTRIGFLASIFSDLILEEMRKMDEDFEVVVGVAINGIPLAVLISEHLGKELAIYRPGEKERSRGGGAFSSNYTNVDGKKVIIIDDVVSTGETMEGAITDVEEEGGEPVLSVVTVKKNNKSEIMGVPLTSLINARPIG